MNRQKTTQWPRKLVGVILALWASALLLYFYWKEGLVRWSFLTRPESGGWFQNNQIPDPRFARPPTHDFDSHYLIIFQNALGPYAIHWDNVPWTEFAIAAAMTGALIALGLVLLEWGEMYLPRLARICLALPLACTVIGVTAEALAMANLLTRWPVAGAWAFWLVFGIAGMLWRRRQWQVPLPLPDGGSLSLATRRLKARDWERNHLSEIGAGSAIFSFVAGGLVLLISGIILLHGIGQPEAYWDSLILYMGFARDTFLQGGFPTRITGQVGMGLGANYPHLYSVLASQTAALAGFWHDSFAQMLTPIASLISTLLVYQLAREITLSRSAGWACALLFRAVPYGISYAQYASDYAIAILFTTAFLYVTWRYVRDALPGYRWLMLLFVAGACHINYLMLAIWPVALLGIFAAHARWNPAQLEEDQFDPDDDYRPVPLRQPSYYSHRYRETIFELLRHKSFWYSFLLAALVASPWFVRNWAVTGNPVYAFYYQIFPSEKVNPAVMESAVVEWKQNGDGLSRAGRTITEKLQNSWNYFVTGSQHWKLSPVFGAFVIPGTLFTLMFMVGLLRLDQKSIAVGHASIIRRFLIPAMFLFLLLWFYAYVIADYYLYQIIIILPLFAVLMAVMCCWLGRGWVRGWIFAVILAAGVAPGLVMALMGFKLMRTGVYEGMPSPQSNLTALRRMFMPRDMFYNMQFGGDYEMIGRVNQLPNGTRVLSHENRTLLFRPEIQVIHLDNWEIQPGYEMDAAERLALLDAEGIEYYLYVPNEDRHPILTELRMPELIKQGAFVKEYETTSWDQGVAENPNHPAIPIGKNVLYRRVK